MKRWFEPDPGKHVRQDGFLSVDRDWAVEQNRDLIRNMVGPNNIREKMPHLFAQEKKPLISAERLEWFKRAPLGEVMKELHMAKKKVKFKTTDGTQPRKMIDEPGKPLGLRLPFAVHLEPMQKREVGLGISCELPVVVTGDLGQCRLFGPGEELSVNIFARLGPIDFSAGEVVARAYVLDCSDVELAE